jgi:hypothetical protein
MIPSQSGILLRVISRAALAGALFNWNISQNVDQNFYRHGRERPRYLGTAVRANVFLLANIFQHFSFPGYFFRELSY